MLLPYIQPTVSYITLKEKYADRVLFYRDGSFYLVYGNDAILASELLGVVLYRPIKVGQPMAILPDMAIDMLLVPFLKSGHGVAIFDQL